MNTKFLMLSPLSGEQELDAAAMNGPQNRRDSAKQIHLSQLLLQLGVHVCA